MAEYGPPRNGIIFFFVVLSVGTLVSLKPAFDSYYDSMYQDAVSDRLEIAGDLEQLQAAEASWNSELSDIDDSISALADSRPAAVRPAHPADMNLDALRGWNQLPQSVPARAIPEPEPEPEPSPEEATDDGAEEAEEAPAPEAPAPRPTPSPEDEPTPEDAPAPGQ